MITVRHIADGDYEVVRGGLVYGRLKRPAVGSFPYDVKPGDRASAAEICEWEDLGVEVKDVTEPGR